MSPELAQSVTCCGASARPLWRDERTSGDLEKALNSSAANSNSEKQFNGLKSQLLYQLSYAP
jgi:hypothetical protein